MIDSCKYFRGKIILVDFGTGQGSEQNGVRPAVVVSNNAHNKYSNTIVVIPLTTKDKHFEKTHLVIKRNDSNLVGYSYGLTEQIRCISTDRVVDDFLGSLTYNERRALNDILRYELDL